MISTEEYTGLIIIAAVIVLILVFLWVDIDQENRYFKKIKGDE